MAQNKDTIFKVMVARIRFSTHDKLVSIAQVDTVNSGRQIYVADLVRDAIKTYLREREDCLNKTVLDGKEDVHKVVQFKN